MADVSEQCADTDLMLAISKYDQTILDLIVANFAGKILEDSVTNPDAYIRRTEEQDEELSKWLASSYWKTESYLEEYTKQRTANSLRWATKMPEFHKWRTSSPGSSNRML
jgi:hypothetical protein